MTTWQNIDEHLDAVDIPHGTPTVAQTTGGQHSATSLHYQGTARDYGNIDTPGGNDGCTRIFNELEQFAQGPGYLLQELFWNPVGCWQRGNRIGPVDGHWDHCHAGLKQGALLPIPDRPKPKPKVFEEEAFLL